MDTKGYDGLYQRFRSLPVWSDEGGVSDALEHFAQVAMQGARLEDRLGAVRVSGPFGQDTAYIGIGSGVSGIAAGAFASQYVSSVGQPPPLLLNGLLVTGGALVVFGALDLLKKHRSQTNIRRELDELMIRSPAYAFMRGTVATVVRRTGDAQEVVSRMQDAIERSDERALEGFFAYCSDKLSRV